MSVEIWVLAVVGAAIVLGGGYRDLDDAPTGVSTPLSRLLDVASGVGARMYGPDPMSRMF